MENAKWNDIWNMLRNNQLEFDHKSNIDVFCIICEKVLKNAYNGPCGCRYCLDCITIYLNEDDKICPGNTNDCKEELLNINHNVHIDQQMNRKILKIVVKCPESNCEFKDQFRKIEDHLRVCSFRSIHCPYESMGCKKFDKVDPNISNHMLTEIVSHTKMLFEFIDNLKNEIQILKDDNIELKRDNEVLKKSMNNSQIIYENINEKIKDLEDKVFEEQKKGVELEREIKVLSDATDSIIINTSEIKRDNLIKISEIYERINDFTWIKEVKSITDLTNEIRVLAKNQEHLTEGHFVWCIDKWKELIELAQTGINRDIYSDVFYSHRYGYKMCLSVSPTGWGEGKGTHLSVFFHLVRGEFDDILLWPFNHSVTFELINQHTTQIHFTRTLATNNQNNEAFQKPKTDKNIGRGFPKFILLKELSNNFSLIDNDKIFIRCRVKIS